MRAIFTESLVHKTLFNTVVYGSNETHIIIHLTWKCKIAINWNFGNKLFWFISSDSCHKKMLWKSVTIWLYKESTSHLLIETPFVHAIWSSFFNKCFFINIQRLTFHFISTIKTTTKDPSKIGWILVLEIGFPLFSSSILLETHGIVTFGQYFIQTATIRLSDCPGQSLFGSGNNDLHYTCPTGQV